MAYIPKNHQKYGVLPLSAHRHREVFVYPSKLLYEVQETIDEQLIPYGFKSYRHYDSYLRELQTKYPSSYEGLQQLRKRIAEMNHKKEWSVLRYIGPDTDSILGLKQNQAYYWPCSFNTPSFIGVIDDEEFTNYLYPTDPELWEILEDPTGMAHKTLYGDE